MIDEVEKEKRLQKEDDKPVIYVSKTWRCNWDDWAIWPWNWNKNNNKEKT